MRTLLLIFLASSLTIFSCSNQQDLKLPCGDFELGKLDNNKYSNSYFCMSIDIPNEWIVLNKKSILENMNLRAENINISKEDLKNTQSNTDILILLVIDSLNKNPMILLTSLNLKLATGIKNETDHLNNLKQTIQNTYQNYEVELEFSEIKKDKINGNEFYYLETKISNESFLSYQRVYSSKYGERLLNIMINYDNETNFEKSKGLLSSIIWTN